MDVSEGSLSRWSHFVHEHFLRLLLASYALAAFFPAPGLRLRDVSLGTIAFFGASLDLKPSLIMLASLLLNAGLGVKPAAVKGLLRHPGLLGAGLATNLLVPIGFILVVTQLMGGWHNADEVQVILVGLALVASMPIAGSSTAWAQNANGEPTLSLGLVMFSTLLSPVLTPFSLRAAGLMASGQYAGSLRDLAAGGTGLFLGLCVLAPSLLGIGLRRGVGDRRYDAARPGLKLVNSAILLALNYSNASLSLPQVISNPDADFLAVTVVIVAALCGLAFGSGWVLSGLLGATPGQKTSLMFGLGMSNNGTGLVLASMALAHHPRVLLPIILYNLTQHLFAGVVDRLTSDERRPSGGTRDNAISSQESMRTGQRATSGVA